MNSYELSRKFVDFSFENPSKIKPNHYALYFFSIEHCNRLGWKKEYGLPTTMTMEAIGIKSYNTYIKTFNDLIDFGFFNLVQRSKNQYSSNIIELSNFDKALDKAFIKHTSKQEESTSESNDSINKQINNKPYNKETNLQDEIKKRENKNLGFKQIILNDAEYLEYVAMQSRLEMREVKFYVEKFTRHINLIEDFKQNMTLFKTHFIHWLNKQDFDKDFPKPSKIVF